MLADPSMKLIAVPHSRVGDPGRFMRFSKDDLVLFSNRLWNSIPEKVKRNPRVTRPLMEIDLSTLESVRIRAGVVI
jgi:hypothetical protein